ncbi:protein of unknown function [Candidatus Hydrogenisulfobacillus filiaventi]|uniref:Uncharacterized protein n=1 Tax=Candidatus Hydrogenisulfobacillus filiaventi TaxID=2707344 RepID=A0A6F8ZK49_9FIRM|nr:protein of unknown function [Candidatus Hydrogenisulfobacillus filiaventi]
MPGFPRATWCALVEAGTGTRRLGSSNRCWRNPGSIPGAAGGCRPLGEDPSKRGLGLAEEKPKGMPNRVQQIGCCFIPPGDLRHPIRVLSGALCDFADGGGHLLGGRGRLLSHRSQFLTVRRDRLHGLIDRLDQAAEVADHRGKGPRQGLQLIARGRDGDRRGEVAVPDHLGRLGQRQQGTGDGADEGYGHQDPEQDGGQLHHAGFNRDPLPVGVVRLLAGKRLLVKLLIQGSEQLLPALTRGKDPLLENLTGCPGLAGIRQLHHLLQVVL